MTTKKREPVWTTKLKPKPKFRAKAAAWERWSWLVQERIPSVGWVERCMCRGESPEDTAQRIARALNATERKK